MKTESGKRVYPRLRILPPSHACKVLVSSLTGQTAPIKPAAARQQIDAIRRSTLQPAPSVEGISFLEAGAVDGRRVIFIHGTPGSATGWADYLINVPPGRLHIALDRPGYGESGPREAVVSLKLQAQAVFQLTQSTNGRNTILVGHSLGAAVAVQTALDFPGAVGGLLLLAGALDPDLEEANLLQPLGTVKPFSWFLPRTIDNANRELLGLKSELLAQVNRLSQIHIPVSVVHGDNDPLVPIENLGYMQQKLVNTSIDTLVLQDTDHFIPWHSKSSIEESLERLINRVREVEQ